MYGLMNPLCWSRSALINSHEQIPLFPQCCLDKLQFHLTLDSNFNGFHRTTVNTSPGIRWLNCKARSVFPASSLCSSPLHPPPLTTTTTKHPHTHTLNHNLYFHTCASCTWKPKSYYILWHRQNNPDTHTDIQVYICKLWTHLSVNFVVVRKLDRIKQDGDRQRPEPCHNDFPWYPPPLSI